ncbi:hypothetical protein KUTeg_017601 [Tegillarca granosa]|uniref:YqaJ viral recombinase domain-containing protein n=1 Tax=Tegillarca granosa TaxID=220873 RepID=A0ABQ9EL95_TEGGR|nr:hypothetical protein KUTeg_017601 [Tegillarca granosa]
METSIHPLEEKMSQMIFKDGNCKGQRESGMWKTLHHGRITSSLFGDVLVAGDSANSLVKLIIEDSNLEKYNRLPEAKQWGIDHEKDAKKDYADIKAAISDNFRIKSFLGASGDGSVTDGTGSGVLEIKCPFSVGGIRVTNMQVSDIIALDDKKFSLENSIEIKKVSKVLCSTSR